jgi:hypothetical protein
MITTGHDFNAALQRLGFIGMRQFNRLSDAGRAEVQRLYIRHLRACKSLQIDADPHFLTEAIGDEHKFGRVAA